MLCSVLLLGAFSTNVSAADVQEGYQIYQYHRWPSTISGTDLVFTPNNNTVESKETELFYRDPSTSSITTVYRIDKINKDNLIDKGKSVKISFNNVYYSILVRSISGLSPEYTYLRDPDFVSVLVKYDDGTEKTFTEGVTFSKKGTALLNFDFEFTPTGDVSQILFNVVQKNIREDIPYPDSEGYYVTFYSGEFSGDDRYQFAMEISSEEAGLLKSIIEWLKGIVNSITEIPQKIWNFFSAAFEDVFGWLEDIWDTLSQLPSKIWEFIENGLKKLFIPSEGYIFGFREDMDYLLADRFGAVYQVVNITLESWDRVMESDDTNSVDIPLVTIPLPDNNSFSFGGYNVTVIPNGFEFIADILKSLVGIICTLLFVNGLRNKYDEVMGVEK